MQTSYERKNAKGQREFGNDALNHKILYILMTEYLILLIWVIALKCNAPWLQELGEEMRSLPFNSRVGRLIIPFYKMIDKGIYFDLDYFMNVLIYIPLGIFLSFITKKKIFLNLAIIFISSAIFEAVQYVTGFGGCDSSDLVCNFLGGILGILLYKLLRSHISNTNINRIALAMSTISLPIVLYAVINTATHWQLYVY